MKVLSSIFCCLCFFSYYNVFSSSQDSIPTTLAEYFELNPSLQPQTAEDGLQYILFSNGAGSTPTKDDYVKIHYKVMALDSSILDSTEGDDPYVFQTGFSYEFPGLDKGISILKKGASALFFVSPELGYEKGRDYHNQALIVQIQLLDILDLAAYDQYMIELEERERIAFRQNLGSQYQKDIQIIKTYSKENRLKIKQTQSGLGYVISKKGKGEFAKPGKTLRVQYEGFLTDNTPIEKNASSKPFEFKLGVGKVMDGWEEGLQYFNKGAEGWLVIPSKLAYGPLSIQEENIAIPANSVLVFRIKVLEIN